MLSGCLMDMVEKAFYEGPVAVSACFVIITLSAGGESGRLVPDAVVNGM